MGEGRITIKPNHFNNLERFEEKILSNGNRYTIRSNRFRYFFPDEWAAFYDRLNKRQKITFNFLINTGARINEVRNIKVSDIDFNRRSIVLRITKTRDPTGQRNIRVISVSLKFIKYIKSIIGDLNLNNNDYFPILSTPAANICLKKTLQEIGISDYKMFSIHNVRKTLETWLLALDIDSLKISKHFGHSIIVASKFYVSGDVFSYEDKKDIRGVIGDLLEKHN